MKGGEVADNMKMDQCKGLKSEKADRTNKCPARKAKTLSCSNQSSNLFPSPTFRDLDSAGRTLLIPLQPDVHTTFAEDVAIGANNRVFDLGEANLARDRQREYEGGRGGSVGRRLRSGRRETGRRSRSTGPKGTGSRTSQKHQVVLHRSQISVK